MKEKHLQQPMCTCSSPVKLTQMFTICDLEFFLHVIYVGGPHFVKKSASKMCIKNVHFFCIFYAACFIKKDTVTTGTRKEIIIIHSATSQGFS